MTPTDIRIAMAEIDGYDISNYNLLKDNEIVLSCAPYTKLEQFLHFTGEDEQDIIPNYPQDLNAIAEFRKRHITSDTLLAKLYVNLHTVITGTKRWMNSILGAKYHMLELTAEEWCEALIKTLAPEKWKD